MAFVKFYIAQVNRAWSTPDASLLQGLFDGACETCATYAAAAVQFKTEGMRVQGDAVEVTSAQASESGPAGQMFVDMQFRQTAAPIVNEAGVVQSRPEVAEFPVRAALVWKEGQWFMRALAEPSK